MKAFILAAILHLLPHPPAKWQETQEAYEARMSTVAAAVADVTRDQELAMAVVVTLKYESDFDPAVHAGTRRGDKGESICLGQHKRLYRTVDQWLGLAGTDLDATRRCVEETARGLQGARGICRRRDGQAGYPEAFVLYGTGWTCNPKEGSAAAHFGRRAERWAALLGRGAG